MNLDGQEKIRNGPTDLTANERNAYLELLTRIKLFFIRRESFCVSNGQKPEESCQEEISVEEEVLKKILYHLNQIKMQFETIDALKNKHLTKETQANENQNENSSASEENPTQNTGRRLSKLIEKEILKIENETKLEAARRNTVPRRKIGRLSSLKYVIQWENLLEKHSNEDQDLNNNTNKNLEESSILVPKRIQQFDTKKKKKRASSTVEDFLDNPTKPDSEVLKQLIEEDLERNDEFVKVKKLEDNSEDTQHPPQFLEEKPIVSRYRDMALEINKSSKNGSSKTEVNVREKISRIPRRINSFSGNSIRSSLNSKLLRNRSFSSADGRGYKEKRIAVEKKETKESKIDSKKKSTSPMIIKLRLVKYDKQNLETQKEEPRPSDVPLVKIDISEDLSSKIETPKTPTLEATTPEALIQDPLPSPDIPDTPIFPAQLVPFCNCMECRTLKKGGNLENLACDQEEISTAHLKQLCPNPLERKTLSHDDLQTTSLIFERLWTTKSMTNICKCKNALENGCQNGQSKCNGTKNVEELERKVRPNLYKYPKPKIVDVVLKKKIVA